MESMLFFYIELSAYNSFFKIEMEQKMNLNLINGRSKY